MKSILLTILAGMILTGCSFLNEGGVIIKQSQYSCVYQCANEMGGYMCKGKGNEQYSRIECQGVSKGEMKYCAEKCEE